MQLKRILLFLLVTHCCFRATAVPYPDSMLFKSYAEQYMFRAELTNEHNNRKGKVEDSEIAGLIEWAERKDDVQLAYGFRVLQLKRNLSKNAADTSAGIRHMRNLASELEGQKLRNLKAECYYALSVFYWNNKRYAEAFEYDINAYKIYKDFDIKDFPAKAEYLFDFGNHYYHFGDFQSAKGYFLKVYNEQQNSDTSLLQSNLNSLALSYMSLGQLDSAEYYYKKGYEVARAKDGSIWTAIISGNLGYLYFLSGDYDRALPWFEEEMKTFGDRPSMNVANTLAILTEIYIAKGDKRKAMEQSLKAYNILQKNENYTRRHNICKAIYMGLSKAYAANGNMELAYKYLDSGMVAKDSVDRKVNANVLAGIQHTLGAHERVLEQEQFERDAKKNIALRNILIASIVLIVIIAVLLINRQRMKYTFSQRQLEAEKEHVESELETATKQMNALVNSISEKNDLIETFTAELDRLREYLSADKLNKADETLSQLQKTTIITDEEWEHFAEMFEKVNNGFLKRLNKKVRGLSPIETKFIMLSKLKLSTKEVASALGISADAVRLNRQRLYAKLGLAEGEHSLQALVESI